MSETPDPYIEMLDKAIDYLRTRREMGKEAQRQVMAGNLMGDAKWSNSLVALHSKHRALMEAIERVDQTEKKSQQ